MKPTEYLLFVFISNLKFYFFLKFEATTILTQGGSEEIIWTGVKEAIEIVKKEWANCKVKILWAGIRRTDGGL